MEKLKSKSFLDIFAILHMIFVPALIIIIAYITMTGINLTVIAGIILVIIGVQVFFSISFASAHKSMPRLMVILEPAVAFLGILIIFLISK